MEIIETNRLILRKPNLSDAYSLLPLLKGSDVAGYVPGIHCNNKKDVISYLQIVCKYNYHDDMCYVIELKNTHKIIGIIDGFTSSDNIFCISCVCMPSERRKGYMTEAVKNFVSYLYHHYHFQSIFFSINKSNLASLRIMEKLKIKLINEDTYFKEFAVSLTEELPF